MPRHELLYLVLICASGCTFVYGAEIDSKQCKKNADCKEAADRFNEPLECRANVCQTPLCDVDDDCPKGASCDEGLCVTGERDAGMDAEQDAGPVACDGDDDCDAESGLRCGYDGFCYEKWGCLDHDPDWPDAPANLEVTAQVIGGTSDPGELGELEVIACGVRDPTCIDPLLTTEDVDISKDYGLTVPFKGLTDRGFRGVIRVLSVGQDPDSDVEDPILPGYLHFTDETPLTASLDYPAPVALYREGRAALLEAALQIKVDPASAGTSMMFFDCGGRPAPGMLAKPLNAPSSTFEPTFIAIQGQGGLLLGPTTTDGSAVMVNVPAGSVTFEIRDEPLDRVITSTFSVLMRTAAFNIMVYFPRYSAQALYQAQQNGGKVLQ